MWASTMTGWHAANSMPVTGVTFGWNCSQVMLGQNLTLTYRTMWKAYLVEFAKFHFVSDWRY
jgi:hypothetical protein